MLSWLRSGELSIRAVINPLSAVLILCSNDFDSKRTSRVGKKNLGFRSCSHFCCLLMKIHIFPSPLRLNYNAPDGRRIKLWILSCEIDLTQKSSIFCKQDIKFSSKRLAGRKCLILPRGFGLLYTEVPLTFDCIKDFVLPFSKQHIKG